MTRTQDYEVVTGHTAVWVNAGDGSCIGRFGRMGIDVHNTMAITIETGEQCLACTHEPTDLSDWATFRDLMLLHHGVTVDHDAMPDNLKPAAEETSSPRR